MKATIRGVDADLKREADAVLADLGLSTPEAINVFLRQVVLRGGLPFDLKLPRPNAETLETFADTDAGRDITTHADAEAMFEHLGI